jgi:peptide deformylase
VRLYGDPVLRTPAAPVVDFDGELHQLVTDLIDTMHDEGGVGMAAPQIGVSTRVFAYDIDDVIGHVVNPRIEFVDDEEQLGPEGCLSIPDLHYDTRRRLNAVAHGFDMFGQPLRLTGSGLLARCFQHETDHLDGILFIDRLDPDARAKAVREIAAAGWNSISASQLELGFQRSLV